MLLRIIVSVLVAAIAVFILIWLLTGGASRALGFAKTLRNPLQLLGGGTASGNTLKLPWQIDVAVPEPAAFDASAYGLPADLTPQGYNPDDEQQGAQTPIQDPKTFGAPSPYRGQVGFIFGASGAIESDPAAEYVNIQASNGNTAPISLAGWSLQSALSGARVPIQQAASPLIAGIINAVSPVSLTPGATVVIVSGPSPVGVSFSLNACSGYLNELQRFVPEIDSSNCPGPAVSPDPQTYGDTCAVYIASIPSCHFPGANQTANVSPACKNLAANALSYNGCVNIHRNDPGFTQNAWRMYLASGVQLWRDSHDVVRLLDAQGQTVDVLTY